MNIENLNQIPVNQARAAEAQQKTEEENRKRAGNFRLFGISSIIYALFYTFCLYRNISGITYPFFIGGTLFYFFLCLKKLGISAKKDSVFYIVSLMLLGISNFCTNAWNIVLMNQLGIFILTFVLIIHNFCEDSKWNFSKYTATVFQTVFGSLKTIGRPFSDFSQYLKSLKNQPEEKQNKRTDIVLGIAISIPLLIIVLMMLSSADVVFASLIKRLTLHIRMPKNLLGICWSVVFGFFASYCIITYMDMKKIKEEVTDKRTGEPIMAIIFTSLLSVVYLIFSGIQILYLFLGNMTLPDGYTYAEYAREGFFQLLFVCLLNLVLVLICLGRFKESRVLKIILTVISVCTYIMIASSAMRMLIYIRFYFLTFLRIFVLWSLLVIFLLMTGVLITIYKEKFPLFRYSMILVTVLYVAFSFSHPDYFIAKYNTAHMEDSEDPLVSLDGRYYSDEYYLSHLSADAAPVLLTQEAVSDTYCANIEWQLKDMTARRFNLSLFIAGQYLPPDPDDSFIGY